MKNKLFLVAILGIFLSLALVNAVTQEDSGCLIYGICDNNNNNPFSAIVNTGNVTYNSTFFINNITQVNNITNNITQVSNITNNIVNNFTSNMSYANITLNNQTNIPTSDNAFNLGSALFRFANAYIFNISFWGNLNGMGGNITNVSNINTIKLNATNITTNSINASKYYVGGNDTQILFNDNGTIGSHHNLTYNKATGILTIDGKVQAGNVVIQDLNNPYHGDIQLGDGHITKDGGYNFHLDSGLNTNQIVIQDQDSNGNVGVDLGSSIINFHDFGDTPCDSSTPTGWLRIQKDGYPLEVIPYYDICSYGNSAERSGGESTGGGLTNSTESESTSLLNKAINYLTSKNL